MKGSDLGTEPRAHAAFAGPLREMALQPLLDIAERARELPHHAGWVTVTDLLAAHERRETDRLLNMTTKPEEVTRLRGLIQGLRSAREALETILAVAEEREREAKKRLEAVA